MDERLFDLPPLPQTDWTAHNEEQREVWKRFYEGTPTRVPMVLGVNPRFLLCDRRYNPRGVSFREYMTDPDIMRRVQCEFFLFRRHFLFYDQEMGLPEQWDMYVDFQNVGEAAWLGAELLYPEGDVPDTHPFLTDDNKNQLFEKGLPDPFSGVYRQMRDWYEYFNSSAYEFLGRPVVCGQTGLGTDGPMTLACNIRGAAEFCMDLYLDEDFAMELLEYITEATIRRVRAWQEYFGLPVPDDYWFADDSIALLSAADYERFILPFHKRLIEGVTTGKGRNHTIHLCGDATRHFSTIRDQLHVTGFDTGYPVEHGRLAQELGPEITIQGGPRVDLLQHGTPEQVAAETRRILEDVMPHTRRFILREANNLPPGTPLASVSAMYDTVRAHGCYTV